MAQTAYIVNVPANLYVDPTVNGNGHSAPVEEIIGFEPLASEAIVPAANPVDWDEARAEVVRLIDAAHSDAKDLIDEGQQRAIELISEAAAHAGDLEEDARKGGFEQGRQDGRNAADAELDVMLTTMRGLVDVARAERHKIIEGAEPEIIRLAMTLAEKVVHQQITLDGSVVVSMARAAISRLVTRETVTVRVNPADIETIRENKEKMLASTDIEHLRIVEDLRVDRGGIVMETESGTIDAKISTQLKEAKRVLQVEDDPVPVAPSDDDTLIASAMRAS
ncbi:MAG: FliH/SctL family protein [Candidatus Eremiobacteraeota bacterium]|nr:FliH/SctL family protein [Candidatus Eremiobacteraeota bacterium]